jgi:hypothetical protein
MFRENLNNVRRETSGTFKKEKEGISERKNNEPETNKDRNIRDLYRDINEFKNGYQLKTDRKR